MPIKGSTGRVRNNTGQKNDSPSSHIGKTGNTEGMKSTGGQLPFLPSANSYEGRMGGDMSGTSEGTKHLDNPAMPHNPTK